MTLQLALAALGLPLLAVALYLALLAALARAPAAPAAVAPRTRFAVVIPAHDEEAGIAATVAAAQAVDWPPALFRVVVVADNCTDATAERARAAGAEVLERADADLRGKGYALAFAFERLLAPGDVDAVVVIDADTVVSKNLLQAFAARLAAGARAVQAHYGVRNPDASWRTRLMAIALALFHKVRSLGRERLGVSCGLRGNGMCFDAALLREVPHDAFSLVEDLEYGVRLGRAGHRVHYAFEAEVLGEMVAGERASRSQRQRWEGGRRRLRRALGWPLLGEALRRRSALLLDLALDVLVPPLGQVAVGAALGTAAAAALQLGWGGPPVAPALYGAVDLLLLLYVLRGWRASGTGARGLLDLAAAPLYVAWKLWLLVARRAPKKDEWVRTTREGETR